MATLTADAANPTQRPHAQRLRFDLDEVRGELNNVARTFTPAEFLHSLSEGARSPRALLQEIGAMEECSRGWAAKQDMADWKTVCDSLDNDDPETVLAKLANIRAETLRYLDTCTEEQLETPIPLPESWYEYFGGMTVIEPEELLRWVCRHEYYHLAQLNTYTFLRTK